MSTVDPGKANKKKELWTLLIYMAGDNNLSEECVYALTEIKNAIDDDATKLSVLAQFDPSGVLAETKRYKLTRKGSLEDNARATGWRVRETNTGEPQNLLDFVRWGISQYPAEHYMVVLVGHGTGTEDDFLLRDENPANALAILELRDIFQQLAEDNHEIDILGFDTCLMNMAEVCFELNRTSVKYLVGSEGFAPNTGWPYGEIIRILGKTVKEQPEQATADWLAKLIVEEYMKFYVPYINGGVSVDQAALEVEKINVVKNRMFTLVGDLLDEVHNGQFAYGSPKHDALVLSHWQTQSYNGEVYVDLTDFCQLLGERYKTIDPKSPVVGSCAAVIEAIDDLVLQNCISGAAFQFSNGLSIYFPWAILSSRYGNLSFPKETKWLDFLKQYHEITRREGRKITDVKGAANGTVPANGSVPTQLPGRASVPTNKGRDGRVDSMRNPAAEEVVALFAPNQPKGAPSRQAAPWKKSGAHSHAGSTNGNHRPKPKPSPTGKRTRYTSKAHAK